MAEQKAPRAPGDPLVTWFVGLFGAFFGFLLLPKALKFLVKRFLLDLISDLVVIVLAGLLTEKAAGMLSPHEDREVPEAE